MFWPSRSIPPFGEQVRSSVLVGLVGVIEALTSVGTRFSMGVLVFMLVKPPYGSVIVAEQRRISCGEISEGVSVRLEVEPSATDVV